MRTTTKKNICEGIARKTIATRAAVKEVVQTFLDEITSELSQGHRVELRGFGVFKVCRRAARKARNPKDKTPVFIPARNAVVFKVGKLIKHKLDSHRKGGP